MVLVYKDRWDQDMAIDRNTPWPHFRESAKSLEAFIPDEDDF
jgi:hypothetical protein